MKAKSKKKKIFSMFIFLQLICPDMYKQKMKRDN